MQGLVHWPVQHRCPTRAYRSEHLRAMYRAGHGSVNTANLQVRGRVRVLLIPPEHAFRGAYAYPLHHPYDTYMMPDLEAPELQAWPGLQAVRGRVCILEPGSSLFVPAYW